MCFVDPTPSMSPEAKPRETLRVHKTHCFQILASMPPLVTTRSNVMRMCEISEKCTIFAFSTPDGLPFFSISEVVHP